jgi:hypothetical protein
MTRSGPAGTIQPDGADPAIEVGPVALRSVGPSPSGPGRPGSSEPRATKPPRLFGAPATAPGTRRRSSSEPRPPLSPRVRTPGSSESGRPLPARRNHPLQRGRLSTALRNGGSSSRDTVAPALRSPARPGRRGSSELQRPSHGTRRRSSSEPRPPPSQDPAPRLFGARWPRPQGSASPPFGARSSPSPGWTFGRTPPAPAGIAVGAVTGFGRRPTPGRTVTTGRQRDAVMRFRLLTRGTLRRVRIAPRELIPAAGRLRATSCRHARNAVNPRPVAGCNRPATLARSKPSWWCETTRTEQEPAPGDAGPTGASAPRSGRAGGTSAAGTPIPREEEPTRGGSSVPTSALKER